jgi:hypothetical protein
MITSCCSNRDCKLLQNTEDFLRIWGVMTPPRPLGELLVFDIVIPDYWSELRRRQFNEALKQLPTSHQVAPRSH